MEIRAWAATDVGNIKKVNEDGHFCGTEHRVFVVADGVSGKRAGEVASKYIVDAIEEKAPALAEFVRSGDPIRDEEHRERVFALLTELVQRINTEVWEKGKEPEYAGGMASTLVLLVLSEDAAFVAHVGDSRVYMTREGQIFRITEDHTYEEEMKAQKELYEQLPERMKQLYSHALTRSIGGRIHVDVDVVFFELQEGDRFLLCSDGLTDYLSGAELLEYMQDLDPDDLGSELIAETLERGGHDNITLVYVEAGDVVAPPKVEPTRKLDTLRKINFLADMVLFNGLTQNDLLRVLRIIYEQEHEAGDVVIQHGDKSKALYLLVDGEVELSRDGRPIARLGRGEHFGELSMFEDSRSSVDITCCGPTFLLAIPLNKFEGLIRDEPFLGNKLLWNVMGKLAEHIGRMNMMVATHE